MVFGQEESWQNPLSVIADAPPIGGKPGAPRAKMGGGRKWVLNQKLEWMVKIMENLIKMDDLGGPPLFLEIPKFYAWVENFATTFFSGF